MNRINKAVYWYVLQVYYLNDQESYKASLLHPPNPERLWRSHFLSNFGRIEALKNYTQQLSERCWEIGVEMNPSRLSHKKLKESIKHFNEYTGLHHVLTPTWTFWNSMFLAVTTYSTIGYGNIAPKSRLGKLAAMLYAVIGIPLVLMILHKLGRFFLLCLEHFWNYTVWFMEFVSCVKNAEKLKGKVLNEKRESGGMPVLLAIGVAFGWMFLCAAIFLKFEKDWDYFKSFYFFFCSLTTIGYGDVTPTNSEDMFIIFGFIIIGLSLVSMCINVIQLKLEELFEELLLAMMEEYGTQAEGMPAPGMKPKMGLVDLWKMWHKRRQRKAAEQNAQNANGTRRKAFSELNIWRIFPFAKRRREALLHEFHTRLQHANKTTQTEFYYHELLHPLSYTRELDEVSWTNGSEPSTEPTAIANNTVGRSDTKRSGILNEYVLVCATLLAQQDGTQEESVFFFSLCVRFGCDSTIDALSARQRCENSSHQQRLCCPECPVRSAVDLLRGR
ncbi:Protein TWK-44 [Aphelenchoides avenae]|nr:Protein TWK-44 [Aphelenchus avenae]